MYSLIIGAVDGILPTERLLEGTDPALDGYLRPNSNVDVSRLLSLPTLLMPEIQDTSRSQIAQVGNVVSLTRSGRDWQFRFLRNNIIPGIPSSRIQAAAIELGIGRYSFNRTHWTVVAADLYQVLIEKQFISLSKPTAFALPITPPEPDLVSVMMPFSAEFAAVWEALKVAAKDGGWLCQRADDIWEDSVLVNDIVGLIARSRVVICDLTGRNANVFYEAGIAHTLGREVILITQSDNDVPFDLGHHRYIKYLNNSEGLAVLRQSLTRRLNTLMAR